MNLTEMYMNSPDWLKLIWTVLPHVTVWILAWIISRKPPRPVILHPAPPVIGDGDWERKMERLEG